MVKLTSLSLGQSDGGQPRMPTDGSATREWVPIGQPPPAWYCVMFEYQYNVQLSCGTCLGNRKVPTWSEVMTHIYIEYSCCPLFDMYILLPCIYVTQTKKEPSLLVKLTSLSLYVQLVDDDLVGPQREAHASDVIGQNHRMHAPVCYVMFEYPMHNFDVAHASQTGNALHHDA